MFLQFFFWYNYPSNDIVISVTISTPIYHFCRNVQLFPQSLLIYVIWWGCESWEKVDKLIEWVNRVWKCDDTLWWWTWGCCWPTIVVWVGWWRVILYSNMLIGFGGLEWVGECNFWVWLIMHFLFHFFGCSFSPFAYSTSKVLGIVWHHSNV